MERQILFRGKRKDTGEWITGWLAESIGGGSCICPSVFYSTYIMDEDDNGNKTWDLKRDGVAIGGFFPVIPETIGQLATVIEFNKQKVFTGDIVTYDTEDGLVTAQVVFKDEGEEDSANLASYKLEVVSIREYVDDASFEFTVVGNIHDNPELLKQPTP